MDTAISMAVTNVGITSASANEIIEVPSIGQLFDAPIVGISGPSTAIVTFASAEATTGSVRITITDPGSKIDATKYRLVNENDDVINGTSYEGEEDAETGIVTFSNVDNDHIGAMTLKYNSTVIGTITVSRVNANDGADDETEAPTVAAGDAFQIPGGLASKGTTVNAYTVGVAKVVTANAGDNEVLADSIKQTDDATDNTLGKWGGEEATKPATGASLAGKYVLYYVPNDSEAKTFVRILTNDEAAKLPKGTFKTDANLTTYTDAAATGATDTDQYKIEHSTATVEGAATQPKTMKDFFGIVFKLANNLNSAFDDTTNGYTANATGDVTADGYVGKTAVPENDTTGQVEVPAISSVAKDKVLIKDKAFVDALIADYNEGKTGSNVFAEKSTTTGSGDDAVTTKWLNIGEDGSYTVSKDGADALYEVLSKDNFANAKKYMTADGVAETTKKLYEEVYARAKTLYINAYNAKMAASDPDLSLVQWTMETLSGDSTKVKDKDVYSKNNGNAKFWGNNLTKKTKNGVTSTATAKDKTATATRVAGSSAFITATKAAKKFNNTVYLKAVKDAYVTPTAKTEAQATNVIFTEQFFVTPALPTAFNPNKLEGVGKDDTAKLSKADGWEDSDTKRNYTLTLDVGKSLKLPFALKDGVEKDLVYEVDENSNGFNVVNGKVTATDAGSGKIKVYSRALGRAKLYADVTVTVNPAVKSVVANTKSISVWPGSSQVITLGTNPASNPGSVDTETNTFTPGDFKYKITAPAGVTVKYKKWQIVDAGEAGTAEDDVYGWGDAALESGGFALSDMIVVEPAAEGTIEKNSVIKVELYKGETKVSFKKDFEIKVNATTVPQDVKSIKATVKAKKDAEGNKTISIPVGGSVNLGCAVTPATADATIDSESARPDVATVCGDVVTGVGEGSTTVTLTPQGKIADGFKSNITNDNNEVVYTIDVYEPGDSILFDDDSDLTIKGGFLMTKAAAATDCNKSFPAGVEIPMPFTDEHGEVITWKCNNPAAIGIVDTTNEHKFIPSIPGTYTITGTTPYTKQKLAFKINVVAENKADNITDAVKSAAKVDVVGSAVVGQKMNAFMSVPNTTAGGIGGTVEFESSKPEVATISKKNGAIVCKSEGTTKITAKMTCGSTTITAEADLVVNSKNVTIKTNKVAAGAIKDEDFAVAVAFNNFDKKTMKLVWTATDSNGIDATSKLSGLSEDKLSGKAKFNAVGTYKISVAVKSGEDPVMGATEVGTVNVYENAVKAANVNNADADTKKAIAALGGKNDPAKENTKFNGAGNKKTYYVPVFVTPKADDKPVPAATADDVTFNISNKSLAKAEFIPKNDYAAKGITAAALNTQENDIVKDYEKAYGLIKIETAPEAEENKISGVVTVKAILKNSNKTVSVKLNVLNKSLTAQMAYAPQSVTELANGVNLAAVVDAGATDAKPMYDNTEKVKAIANSKTKDNATFKVWKYVLVNDSNVKNVNKAQATKMIDTATVTVGSADGTTGLSNVKFTFPDGVTAPADGTWYLALAESTIKVTKKAVKADANATPKVDAEDAVYSQSAITVKKIASKTPITKIAAAETPSGGESGSNEGETQEP